ncbi:VRR-NUC domain-containing protein [Thermorudis peleae]|uniref:VRR-NUC domain-containing protein n=1 Tax=Thermorudis peleae TaxID=1382356 RepID=UPI00056FCF6A|nr:VRR-NUC domain-containing protein [Thermorudis peleae]
MTAFPFGRHQLDAAVTEKAFTQQVIELARLLGWTVYHTWLSVRSPAGFPDLVLAKPGRPLILAELKSERGRLSPAQEQWLAVLRQVPGICVEVWRPSEWDRIVAVLQGEGLL